MTAANPVNGLVTTRLVIIGHNHEFEEISVGGHLGNCVTDAAGTNQENTHGNSLSSPQPSLRLPHSANCKVGIWVIDPIDYTLPLAPTVFMRQVRRTRNYDGRQTQQITDSNLQPTGAPRVVVAAKQGD